MKEALSEFRGVTGTHTSLVSWVTPSSGYGDLCRREGPSTSPLTTFRSGGGCIFDPLVSVFLSLGRFPSPTLA